MTLWPQPPCTCVAMLAARPSGCSLSFWCPVHKEVKLLTEAYMPCSECGSSAGIEEEPTK